ncbi:MAG: serine/threonine protein kinase [Alphaproteobacteria bacterium]
MTIDHRNALASGTELFGYRIESVLGHGGFGITYKATEMATGHRVAIKEYLPAGFSTRDPKDSSVQPAGPDDHEDFDWGLQSFGREAQTLVSFHHPNIVAVERFFEANNTAYLVMKYERGDSLAAILARDNTLPENEIREFLNPLMDGLSRVHKAGFMHRDIKPENIFIRTDGTPVLLDFGSARQAAGAHSHSLTSIVSGGYAPFEQYFEEGNQGPWSDIYALGATLYRAIIGKKPIEATARMTADALIPAAKAGARDYSPELLNAIDAALALDDKDRPRDVGAFRAILEGRGPRPTAPAATPGGPGQARQASPPPPPAGKPPASMRLIAIGIGGFVLVLLAGGLAYYLWQEEQSSSRAAEELRRKAERQAADLRRRGEAEKRRRENEARRRRETRRPRAGSGKGPTGASAKRGRIVGKNLTSFQIRNRCRFGVKILVRVKDTNGNWITVAWTPIEPSRISRAFYTTNRHVYYYGASHDGRTIFNKGNLDNPKKALSWQGRRYTVGHVNMGAKFIRWTVNFC